MSKLFKSGVQVGNNTIRFTSREEDVANQNVGTTKRTICKIIDQENNVVSKGSVRLLSSDVPNNDVARKNAAFKALQNVESKQTKKELFQWWTPKMQMLTQ